MSLQNSKVSLPVIKRLPKYYRYLADMKKNGVIKVSSSELGTAISSYLTVEAKGYRLIGAFDKKAEVIGQELCGVAVRDVQELESFCKKYHPVVAVLCIPRESAKELAPTLVSLGIKGFWNFSHYDLSVDFNGITVENAHLGKAVFSLRRNEFRQKHGADAGGAQL